MFRKYNIYIYNNYNIFSLYLHTCFIINNFSSYRKKFGFRVVHPKEHPKTENPPTTTPDPAPQEHREQDTSPEVTGSTPPKSNSEPQTASTEVHVYIIYTNVYIYVPYALISPLHSLKHV